MNNTPKLDNLSSPVELLMTVLIRFKVKTLYLTEALITGIITSWDKLNSLLFFAIFPNQFQSEKVAYSMVLSDY